MDQATAYMAALAETTHFAATVDQLSLSNGDQIVATFVAGDEMSDSEVAPQSNAELEDTGWVLSSLNDELPVPGSVVTLQFGADSFASGSDGCNQYNIQFTQEDDTLSFGEQGASTLMACPEAVTNQASAYMTALSETTSFTLSEDQLVLNNGGQPLATFVSSSSELASSSWDVVSYNNGREAVVGLVLGTEISAVFGEDDQLSGEAGCNQYFAGYTAGDGVIAIGETGTTFRFCIEPPGVMEQESEYLAALQSAATYSFQGNVLEMRTAEDQIAVIMTRKLAVDLPEPPPATASGRVVAPQGANIRSGPGINFPVIGLAVDGDEGEIVGRSADNRWWAVSMLTAPDDMGWLSVDLVIATNTEDVPVVESPPPVVVLPTMIAATPTSPPAPTATPAPDISFSAQQTSIAQGECTRLRWSVENIQAVWVYPQGERFDRFPRTGQGSEEVCPSSTTTYEMRVLQRDGTIVIRQVTIEVTGATNPLSDTRWEVTNYNNGREALISVIADTRISLDFGAEGQLSGSAGCNNYFSSYQVNSNSIFISQPGSSAMFCVEPEGIMDQEAAFLTALQSVTTFRVDGNMLEMRMANDQIALVASRAP